MKAYVSGEQNSWQSFTIFSLKKSTYYVLYVRTYVHIQLQVQLYGRFGGRFVRWFEKKRVVHDFHGNLWKRPAYFRSTPIEHPPRIYHSLGTVYLRLCLLVLCCWPCTTQHHAEISLSAMMLCDCRTGILCRFIVQMRHAGYVRKRGFCMYNNTT